MCIELKIKSKSLAEEAKIIRKEEERLKRRIEYHKARQMNADKFLDKWHSLNQHRRWDVRNENRATYLARAYIEKAPYFITEQSRRQENESNFHSRILPKVVVMVNKYSNEKVDLDAIKEWARLPSED